MLLASLVFQNEEGPNNATNEGRNDGRDSGVSHRYIVTGYKKAVQLLIAASKSRTATSARSSPHPHPLRIQRKLLRHLPYLPLHPLHRRLIPLRQHLIDQLRHALHLLDPEAPRRQRRRPQANAARHKRRLRIARNRVLVHRDRRAI